MLKDPVEYKYGAITGMTGIVAAAFTVCFCMTMMTQCNQHNSDNTVEAYKIVNPTEVVVDELNGSLSIPPKKKEPTNAKVGNE